MRDQRDNEALERLMIRYADGDKQAFDALYSALRPAIVPRLRRLLRTEQRVNDALQNTFLKLHRSRHTYRPGMSVAAWVQTIARNVAYDDLRRARRGELRLGEDEAEAIVDVNAQTDRSDCEKARDITLVRRAIAELPPKSREVVQMHKLDELPLTVIAEQLGINVSTARVRAHRGYKKLRVLLDGQRFRQAHSAWGCS